MTTLPHYNILVPRIDTNGPCNLAVDLGKEALRRGYSVHLFCLGGVVERNDLSGFHEVRKLKFTDIFRLKGLLHTHCLRPDLVGGLFALIGHCKVLTTIHNYFQIDLGFDHKTWKVRIAWIAWKFSISRMDRAVCISRSMFRYYRKRIPGAKFEIAYNFRSSLISDGGTETIEDLSAQVIPWLRNSHSAGRVNLVFVGALTDRKNILGFVKALSENEAISLIVCGRGPLEESISLLVSKLNLDARVLMLGYVSAPHLIIDLCDALVLPSRAEGMPLVVVEACALGKQSLLSNIAVHRELASLGMGVTFNHRTFGNLRKAVNQLNISTDVSSREKIKKIWEACFSPEVGFDRYESIFKKINMTASHGKLM